MSEEISVLSLEGYDAMNEPKHVVLKLEGNALSLEVNIREDQLVAAILSALAVFVSKGSSLKITQYYTQTLSKSQSIATTVISRGKDLLSWADDLQARIRSHQAKLKI